MSQHNIPPEYERFLRSVARQRAEDEFDSVVHQAMVCDEAIRLYAKGTKPADAIEEALKSVRRVRRTQIRNARHEQKKRRPGGTRRAS